MRLRPIYFIVGGVQRVLVVGIEALLIKILRNFATGLVFDCEECVVSAGARARIRSILKNCTVNLCLGERRCQINIVLVIAGFVSDRRKGGKVLVVLVPSSVTIGVNTNSHYPHSCDTGRTTALFTEESVAP